MSFQLTIVTPQGESYRGDAKSILLPGSEGEFGVLELHERFLSPLVVGEVKIETGSEMLLAAISGGFAEVNAESVTVLVDACELAADIDLERAQAAKARAEKALSELVGDGESAAHRQLDADLARAENRLAVARGR